MNETLQQPSTPEEQAEVDYGNNLIWRLVGSKIVTFGANAAGEIFLIAEKTNAEGESVTTEVIVGKDERGDIALFEVEKQEIAA